MESIDALLEQRITLMERLAECADEIKRIDEQLKSTDASLLQGMMAGQIWVANHSLRD